MYWRRIFPSTHNHNYNREEQSDEWYTYTIAYRPWLAAEAQDQRASGRCGGTMEYTRGIRAHPHILGQGTAATTSNQI